MTHRVPAVPFPFLKCTVAAVTVISSTILAGCTSRAPTTASERSAGTILPTGVSIDPAGTSFLAGSMPLALTLAPDGDHAALLLGGSRQQGVQLVSLRDGRVLQTLDRASTFVGMALARDGRSLWVSGGDDNLVLRYDWTGPAARLADSIVLAPRLTRGGAGTSYPAGLALSPDGSHLYVAENLADSLAVVDIAAHRVVQRFGTERYPYGVAVTPDGTVFVSAWGGHTVSVFTPDGNGLLRDSGRIPVGRHPSALVLNGDGSRLFVASASTDRVAVIDTRARRQVAELNDAPATGEGRTIDALALSADGGRLFAAEADANAIAVFELSSTTAGRTTTFTSDRVAGRIPTGWYPTAIAFHDGGLVVVNGKGRGTAPNPNGPNPVKGEHMKSLDYTLSQTSGTVTRLPADLFTPPRLAALTTKVATLNHELGEAGGGSYPPIGHVVYVIKENRTYDQVLGDLPGGDGDTALVFFPRPVSPNHHALAERFGVYDRFLTNAEVSADGHNWSTAAYATDYVQKTVPSNYSGRGRSYDYEGTNRGFGEQNIPDDDVAEPANGYLWDAAVRAGVTLRNYGEFTVEAEHPADSAHRYIGNKPALRTRTVEDYPKFDLAIPDQRRADVWIRELNEDVRRGNMPALEIVRLPNDHTSGARAGMPTPRAAMADNDLALGRMIEALSRSPFWRSSVVFVLEDDAQNGSDHVDSHRSVLLTISPWARGGAVHRFANTTDVIATMRELLHLPPLSPFDLHGHPLRDIWREAPDLRPYTALAPSVPLGELNPARGRGASASAHFDLRGEDRVDDDTFNRVLWYAMKGSAPYPAPRRLPAGAPVDR